MESSSTTTHLVRALQKPLQKDFVRTDRDKERYEHILRHGTHSVEEECDAENRAGIGMQNGDAIKAVHEMAEVLSSLSAKQGALSFRQIFILSMQVGLM